MNFKKNLFVLVTLLLSVGFISCSDDGDDMDFRHTPFEIELKIKTDATYRGTAFDFFAPEIFVDWGDGSETESWLSQNGSIITSALEHQYPESNTIKEYTVKITGKGLQSFTIKPDPNNNDVLASIIKSVDFKNCPNLTSVSLLGIDEMKSLDFNKLPALEQLVLEATYFTDFDCSNKASLQRLILENNQLLESLKCPTSLKAIALTNNPLLTEEVVKLSRYKELNSFYLSTSDWTSVNLSPNKKLESLILTYNDIEDLDISLHSNLEYLILNDMLLSSIVLPENGFPNLLYAELNNNKLDANTLNAIFKALPTKTDNPNEQVIYVRTNPGSESCDTKIATDKGWKVYN